MSVQPIAAGFGLPNLPPPAPERDLHLVFLHARQLAEVSNILRRMPKHPELADLRQTYSQQVEEAIWELRKVIDNG